MRRRIIPLVCLLVAFLVLFSGVVAFAATPEKDGPFVWIEDQTVTAGDTFYIDIQARDLENVASLSLSLLYDAEQFEFLTVSAQEMIDEEICSTNTKTQGHIGLDFISLSGVNGSGNIWRVALRAKSTATAAKHNLMLAVGEAYNTALSPISVYSENASVEVNGAYQGYNTIEFYSGYSNYSVTAGEQVTLWMYSGNLLGLAAADFELEYNHLQFYSQPCYH